MYILMIWKQFREALLMFKEFLLKNNIIIAIMKKSAYNLYNTFIFL